MQFPMLHGILDLSTH